MSRRRSLKISASAFSIVILLGILFLVGVTIFDKEKVAHFLTTSIARYGIVSLFFINFLLDFIPQLMTPYSTLVSFLFVGFNPQFVIWFTITGALAGSMLGFEVGRKYGEEVVEDFVKKKTITKITRFMNNYGGKVALLIAAISPLPYIPMIVGSLNMTRKNFIVYGLLVRFFGLLIVGYAFYFKVML